MKKAIKLWRKLNVMNQRLDYLLKVIVPAGRAPACGVGSNDFCLLPELGNERLNKIRLFSLLNVPISIANG